MEHDQIWAGREAHLESQFEGRGVKFEFVEQFQLDQIKVPRTSQVRTETKTSQVVLRALSDQILSPLRLRLIPAIWTDWKYWAVDGVHRTGAGLMAGIKTCNIYRLDAEHAGPIVLFNLAVQNNAAHGRLLTDSERMGWAVSFHEQRMPYDEIAAALSINANTARAYIHENAFNERVRKVGGSVKATSHMSGGNKQALARLSNMPDHLWRKAVADIASSDYKIGLVESIVATVIKVPESEMAEVWNKQYATIKHKKTQRKGSIGIRAISDDAFMYLNGLAGLDTKEIVKQFTVDPRKADDQLTAWTKTGVMVKEVLKQLEAHRPELFR